MRKHPEKTISSLMSYRESFAVAPGKYPDDSLVIKPLIEGLTPLDLPEKSGLILQLWNEEDVVESVLTGGVFQFRGIRPGEFNTRLLGNAGSRFSHRGTLTVDGARREMILPLTPRDGHPVEVTVMVSSNGRPSPFRGAVAVYAVQAGNDWQPVEELNTDQDGKITFSALAMTQYVFLPTPDKAAQMEATWSLMREPVTVREGDEIVIASRRYNTIVTLAPEAVEKTAVVTAYDVSGNAAASSFINAKGHAVLDLAPGSYDFVVTGLKASLAPLNGKQVPIQDNVPGIIELEFGEEPPTRTAGYLALVPDDAPAPAARLFRIRHANDRWAFELTLEPIDGAYHLPPLPPGKYSLDLVSKDERWQQTVDIGEGKTKIACNPEPRKSLPVRISGIDQAEKVLMDGKSPLLDIESGAAGSWQVRVPVDFEGRLHFYQEGGCLISPPGKARQWEETGLEFSAGQIFRPRPRASYAFLYESGWCKWVLDGRDTMLSGEPVQVIADIDGVLYHHKQCCIKGVYLACEDGETITRETATSLLHDFLQ